MYCKKCGAYIPENNKFCKKCGTPQIDEVVEITPENASSESVQVNKSPFEQNNTVPLAGNETPIGKYYQPVENAYEAMGHQADTVTAQSKRNNKVTIVLVVLAVILAITITLIYIGSSQKGRHIESEAASSQSGEGSVYTKSTNNTTESAEYTTENATSYESSATGMVSLYDYKEATKDLSMGLAGSIYVDDFTTTYDNSGLTATLYLEGNNVGSVVILTEVIENTQYVKRVTVTTSLLDYGSSFETKEEAARAVGRLSVAVIMPLLNDCRAFSVDDVSKMIMNTVTNDGTTVEGNSNNYHYSYSQPYSYYKAIVGCEYNG